MRRWVFIALVLASSLTVSLFVLGHQVELGTMYTLYRFTGPFVRNCGLVGPEDDPKRVAGCVERAQRAGKPYLAVFQIYGRDSKFTEGMARNRAGGFAASGYDDMAPDAWFQDTAGKFGTLGNYRFLFRRFRLIRCAGIAKIPGREGRLCCRPLLEDIPH